jgi:hypothetical protein
MINPQNHSKKGAPGNSIETQGKKEPYLTSNDIEHLAF